MGPTGIFEILYPIAHEFGTSCAFFYGAVALTVTGLVGQIVLLHVATYHPSVSFHLLLTRRQPLAVVTVQLPLHLSRPGSEGTSFYFPLLLPSRRRQPLVIVAIRLSLFPSSIATELSGYVVRACVCGVRDSGRSID